MLITFFAILLNYFEILPERIPFSTISSDIFVLSIFIILINFKKLLFGLATNPLVYWLFFYIGASTLWSLDFHQTIHFWRDWMIAFAFGVVLVEVFSASELLYLLTAVSVAFIILNLICIVWFPSEYIMWQPKYYGAWKGLPHERNTLAFFSSITLVAPFAVCKSPKNWFVSRLALLPLTILTVFTIYHTGSATGQVFIAVFFAVALTMPWLRKKGRLGDWKLSVMLAVGLAVATALFFTAWYIPDILPQILHLLNRDETLTGRTDVWHNAWLAFMLKPWLGYGAQNIFLHDGPQILLSASPYIQGLPYAFWPHNLFIAIMLKFGVAGSLLFFTFLGQLLGNAFRTCRLNTDAMADWHLLMLTVICVYGMTLTIDFMPIIWVMFGIMMAMQDKSLTRFQLSSSVPVLKRSFDIVAASVLFIILCPFMVLITLVLALYFRGNPFFLQSRTGSQEQEFTLYKFRTLTMPLEEGTTPQYVLENDGLAPPLGRFLRNTGIDELPQLLNIIRGNMSLVGPRPQPINHLPYYRDLVPNYLRRHEMLPGMTGLVQISPMRQTKGDIDDVAARTGYDLYYIEHWSLWLDFMILLKTAFPAMIPWSRFQGMMPSKNRPPNSASPT